jgi:hypothetical protein
MKTVATLMVVVTLVLGAVTGVRADDIGAVMSGVAAKVQELSDVKGRKVGVGHFPLASGPITEIGVFLADQLDVALTNRSTAGGYQMVSRSHLCEVIRETRLWVGDQFDPNLTKKLGHFGGADLLALGRITELGDKLSLSVRIVDTESGRAVWADSHLFDDRDLRKLVARPISGGGCGETAETSPLPPVAASNVAAPARPPVSVPDPLRVDVWADKQLYRVGDTIEFSVRVNRDAYVTLINIGASGDVTVIFPNKFHPSHFVRAGQTVVIPAPTWNFSFVVQGPPGFDQIKAVASEEPIALLPGGLSRGEEPAFRSLDRVQTRNIVTAIRTEKEKTAPGRFTERVIAVEVRR